MDLIEDAHPADWRLLQHGVARIFSELGLRTVEAKNMDTPRGQVELDVHAIDEQSVDQISYVVECKNWEARIPQTVVHSFTTVMHEVGANIGYIISRYGLQPGAEAYTANTNIRGMTYEEFQRHYGPTWIGRSFAPAVARAVDPLVQYIEPFNSFRDREVGKLDTIHRRAFVELMGRHASTGMGLAAFMMPNYLPQFSIRSNLTIDQLKGIVSDASRGLIVLQSRYYRALRDELVSALEDVTRQFDDVFGHRIFEQG